MQEVAVSREVDAAPADLVEALTPRKVVEWAGTYEVWDVEETESGWTVHCGTPDLDVLLDFTPAEGGYVYRQRADRGPFGAMYASVSVAESSPAVVTGRSCFTFDSPLSRLLDWLAARERRTELRRVLDGLALAVDAPAPPSDEGT